MGNCENIKLKHICAQVDNSTSNKSKMQEENGYKSGIFDFQSTNPVINNAIQNFQGLAMFEQLFAIQDSVASDQTFLNDFVEIDSNFDSFSMQDVSSGVAKTDGLSSADLSTLQSKLSGLQASLTEKTKELANVMSGKHPELLQMKKSYETKETDLKKTLELRDAQTTSKIATLNSRIKNSEQAMSANDTQISQGEANVSNLKSGINDLSASKNDLEGQISNCESSEHKPFDFLSKLKNSLNKILNQIKQKQNELTKTESNLSKLKLLKVKLKMDKDKLEDEKESLEKQSAENKQEMAMLDREVEKAKTQYQNYKEKLEIKLNSEIDEIKQQINAVNKEILSRGKESGVNQDVTKIVDSDDITKENKKRIISLKEEQQELKEEEKNIYTGESLIQGDENINLEEIQARMAEIDLEIASIENANI